ncbi:MAG: hypothetical protein KDM64_00840 [Verrucomicrobiae bacterium]|nr:hypothetical protein [Verrucomicrobiae bacterium]
MKLNSPKVFGLLVVAVIAVGIGLIVVMFKTGPESRKPADSAAKATEKPAAVTVAEGNQGKSGAAQTVNPSTATEAPAGTPPPAKTVEPSKWKERIEELLSNQEISTRDASRELLAMAADSKGPEQLRIDAVQHGLNLLEDENYLNDALFLATRTDLPEEMQDILFADLHNRDQEISVPVADKIAKTPGHPLAEDAKDFVDFFKEDDDPSATPIK